MLLAYSHEPVSKISRKCCACYFPMSEQHSSMIGPRILHRKGEHLYRWSDRYGENCRCSNHATFFFYIMYYLSPLDQPAIRQHFHHHTLFNALAVNQTFVIQQALLPQVIPKFYIPYSYDTRDYCCKEPAIVLLSMLIPNSVRFFVVWAILLIHRSDTNWSKLAHPHPAIRGTDHDFYPGYSCTSDIFSLQTTNSLIIVFDRAIGHNLASLACRSHA